MAIYCNIVLYIILISNAAFGSRSPYWLTPSVPDFVCTRFLSDGELERRVHRGRISAIETIVELSSGMMDNEIEPTTLPSMHSSNAAEGLTLRQVTDGRHFIQLIYDSGWELRDCEYLKDRSVVDEFFRSFTEEPACRQYLKYKNGSSASCCGDSSSATSSFLEQDRSFSGGNYTLRLLSESDGEDLNRVTDYRNLRQQCQSLHERVKNAMKRQHYGNHHQVEDTELKRLKRDLFLYPGTNWCGSGSNARKFNELGYNAAADRCCRDHDHCPHTIEGFTTKYNFFNFRFHTLSHCDCDERFRACLKLSSTAAGNMVGRLFFNVVQTKCFLFKMEKKCAKRSWWGKCLKTEKQKRAVLRDALSY